MREAFVCINASPDSVDKVFTELKACKEVKEAFRVYGVYDIIARVSGESLEDLSSFINTYKTPKRSPNNIIHAND